VNRFELPSELALVEGLTIAAVSVLRGAAAPVDAAPDLLIEVPHGADRRVHYDALFARLRGPFPTNLHWFFHVNTDVGAWPLGVQVARELVEADPHRTIALIRSHIPRTFIDCNRRGAGGGELGAGGMTAGLAPYVHDPEDQAFLLRLHAAYVEFATRWYERTCGAGGLALSPHTYAPRTVGIQRIDDEIVENLARVYAVEDTWPLRPEVDLITVDANGQRFAPEGLVPSLIDGYARAGITAIEGGTYTLHPATLGALFTERWPSQVLSLEVRRDLLMRAWTPFEEMEPDPASIARFAGPLVAALDHQLRSR